MLTKDHVQTQLREAADACKNAERLLAGEREPAPLALGELSVQARKLSEAADKLAAAVEKALANPEQP